MIITRCHTLYQKNSVEKKRISGIDYFLKELIPIFFTGIET